MCPETVERGLEFRLKNNYTNLMSNFLNTPTEVSFDLIMEDDMDFVEGCYRLPGKNWQVFVFSKRGDLDSPEHQFVSWASGVTGVTIQVPTLFNLDSRSVKKLLSTILNIRSWETIKGPDSIVIR